MTTFLVLTVCNTLALWVIVSTRGPWAPRAAAILVALTVNVLVLAGGPTGLPTTDDPPGKSRFAGCLVDESHGLIYLWLVEDYTPRAYTQPYNRGLHETCSTALKAAARGERVGFERSKPTAGVPGQEIPKWAFHAYQLPPPVPPSKEAR